MGRHLPSARGRVGGRAYRLLQHLIGRHPHGQHQRPVAIVGIEPIVPRPQHHTRGGLNGFVPGAADLEVNAVLAFQGDLAVVQPPARYA